ncbi:MAG: UPF0175 family protein [Defluviitaleaceae bacterium]|nr:UPF0175 family protein [Defluviitaleaceae bacterium]
MKTVTIPIADEVLFATKKDIAHIQADFRQTLAVQYFKDGLLGLSLAAQMAGLQKNEFVTVLSRQGIDIYQYANDELQNEFTLVDDAAIGRG